MRSLLFFCFLLTATSGFAQQDVLVFSDGSEQRGTIKRGPYFELGQEVVFRKAGASSDSRFAPQRIQEFTLARSERTYRSVNTEIPGPYKDSKRKVEQRIGRVLVDGDIQLIRINLKPDEYDSKAAGMRNYFYLLRTEGKELRLELTTIYVYDMPHANPSRFRNKLKYIVYDCPEALTAAKTADFTDAAIMRIIHRFAECKNTTNVEMDDRRVSSKRRSRHFIRAEHLSLLDEDYNDQQFSAAIGYQFETRFTGWVDWLGVQIAADYVYQSFRWQETDLISQDMFRGNISFGVYPVSRPDFSVQLSAGLSNYNAFQSSFNSFFSNNYFLPSTSLRVQRNRWLLTVAYEFMPNPIIRQPGAILRIGVGWRLPIGPGN